MTKKGRSLNRACIILRIPIYYLPRGSIYTTYGIRHQKKPSPLWFWGPNSIMVVYAGPSGLESPL